MIKYARYRKRLEKQYEHTCTISRNEEYKNPLNRQTEHGPVEKYKDIPCRLSNKRLSSNNQTETINSINYETKLFISPDVVILQGDEIEVTQLGSTVNYIAGEPFKYAIHQEVVLSREDKS